jgi:hypothetical protein
MYESRQSLVLSRRHFSRRLVLHSMIAGGLMLCSIGFGVAGYCYFEKLSVVDALLNTTMLLCGMGPVNAPLSVAGKLFASAFALYSGLIFLAVAGLMAAPILHRLLHTFHWDQK